MTTPNEAREAIYLVFDTAWAGATSVAYANEKLDTTTLSEWVRFEVVHVGSTQQTLGAVTNRKFRRVAFATANIFIEGDEGTARGDALAKIVRDAFEGTEISGTTVFFKDVIVRELGSSDRWFEYSVEAELEYTETK